MRKLNWVAPRIAPKNHSRRVSPETEKLCDEGATDRKVPLLEEIFHKISYPMRTASDDVPYAQQNQWIVDERLSYRGACQKSCLKEE